MPLTIIGTENRDDVYFPADLSQHINDLININRQFGKAIFVSLSERQHHGGHYWQFNEFYEAIWQTFSS